MALSFHTGGFDDMELEWEGLLRSSSTNTIFVTPSWQRTWWRHFGAGWELRIISVRDGDVTLGIAPLMLRDGVAQLVGESDVFDYLDFIVPEAYADRFYGPLCDHLAALDWGVLDLKSLPQSSPTLRALPEVARKAGYSVEVTEEDKAPVAELPLTWDEYLGALAKKDRHELRRKFRRLDNVGTATQHTCSDPDTLPACMQEFFRLHRLSSPAKKAFLTPERQRFFLEIARELAPRGQFKLFFLDLDGARVASCICFDYEGSYLLYNSGYDPEHAGLSVGLLNKALCIKEAIAEGRRSFEFLRGAERYKYDLGGQDRSLYRMLIRR